MWFLWGLYILSSVFYFFFEMLIYYNGLFLECGVLGLVFFILVIIELGVEEFDLEMFLLVSYFNFFLDWVRGFYCYRFLLCSVLGFLFWVGW